MKKIYLLLFSPFLFLSTFGQCSECVPDESCVPEVAFPALCPEFLPDATAGEFYETVMTFYMPAELEDPESGLVVSLNEIVVNNVSGLPFGLSFELSSPTNTYYPSQGEEFGCATLCGTPILPGEYIVNVFVTATVTVFGINQVVEQSFAQPLLVLPGENTLASFAYDNLAACDTLEVTFEALIDGAPSPTTYAWDFGNGQSSDQANPPTQIYSSSGEYTVSLQTDITYFVLETVNATSFNNNWVGDIEEFTTLFNPDPYFVLTDGDGVPVYTSATIDDVLSASWTDLNITLNNPPYSITFWDEDAVSSDDNLGTTALTFAAGVSNFNANGTQGLMVIGTTPGPSFYDELVVAVLPEPNATFTVDEENFLLSYDDPELDVFTWFFNGELLEDEIGPQLIADNPGVYYCVVQNIYGCTAVSHEWTLCPDPVISFDETEEVLSVQSGFASYQWFYNGLEVSGFDGPDLPFQGFGNYAVNITTDYGCEVESEVLSIVVGIEEFSGSSLSAMVFPNPAGDQAFITLQGIGASSVNGLFVYDMTGRQVLAVSPLNLDSGNRVPLDVSVLAPGTYLVEVVAPNYRSTTRFVVNR